MRGILLAGGKGTRMYPATKYQNKHLLPVYSNDGAVPMLHYPLNTLVKSGIKEILVISSKEHCGSIIENIGDGMEFDADITYKIQDFNHVPLGIASALKLAKNFTADQNFAVILGDNFYSNTFRDEISDFEKNDFMCTVFLKEVKDIKRFGCATLDKNGNVTKIVEKPNFPESDLAVTGLYLYTPHVYEVSEKLQLSDRGELEISDINYYYCPDKISGKILTGEWSDMGTPASILHTQQFLNNQ